MNKNTIILGDLNAKHTIWGSSCNNDRGKDILKMMNDKEFMTLNDGIPTQTSLSYNTSEALDISIISADIFLRCTWSVLDHIGSDHFPILIKFSK
ncbi:RNA-directed DNA polymerase from mobile element jockey [Trichonephila clavata]|uniref:RNA-directed DNA polymerase from mobile element jockey n=1 Tax=Trichonephila clavata TaxID=2740835 RepID=A0A8X6FZ62_TRICU|nr:RNA-directed DNA polymerase from mobile element jockey [Trichonephila clavata]